MSENRTYFATTAKTLEPLLVEELKKLGAQDVTETRAGASFKGDLKTAYRVCLWSRIANRVLLPLKSFPAPDPAKLYGGVKSIRWSDHLSAKETLAVDFTSSDSQITHTHFGALKVKDAIVDQLRSVLGERPSIDPIRPDIRINVYVLKDVATVSLDLSGESLHRRGYRTEDVGAPLKETLAAAILMHADWEKRAAEGDPFIDPMCGSGTLAIEAAMIALDIAPGLSRRHYGFLGWKGHDDRAWRELLDEASERDEAGDERKIPKIVGYDRDARAIQTSIANLERAGLRGKVHFEKREFSELQPIPEATRGLIVMNPPYGERLGEVEELKPLYKQMGDIFKQRFKGWDAYVLTSNPDLAKSVGLKTSRRIPIYNGAIECRVLKYSMY